MEPSLLHGDQHFAVRLRRRRFPAQHRGGLERARPPPAPVAPPGHGRLRPSGPGGAFGLLGSAAHTTRLLPTAGRTGPGALSAGGVPAADAAVSVRGHRGRGGLCPSPAAARGGVLRLHVGLGRRGLGAGVASPLVRGGRSGRVRGLGPSRRPRDGLRGEARPVTAPGCPRPPHPSGVDRRRRPAGCRGRHRDADPGDPGRARGKPLRVQGPFTGPAFSRNPGGRHGHRRSTAGATGCGARTCASHQA